MVYEVDDVVKSYGEDLTEVRALDGVRGRCPGAVEPAARAARGRPAGNLDSTTGGDLIALLRRLNDGGQTIVLTTHDRAIAERAPRTIEMGDGRLQDALQPFAGVQEG